MPIWLQRAANVTWKRSVGRASKPRGDAEGAHLTGTWEELTFNASGTVTGNANDGEIALTIDGGRFGATMLVSQDDQQQTVSISAHGVVFTKVNVALSRNAREQYRECK